MFKDSITATQLKNYGEELSCLTGKDAVQVLHRGAGVKVVITQEYFFHLLGAERMAFPTESSPVEVSLDEAKSRGRKLAEEKNKKQKQSNKKERSA